MIALPTENRTKIFDAFRTAAPPALLMSPSAHVGEDFRGDQARYQIIARLPYPPMGDPWVKAKMAADPDWPDRLPFRAYPQLPGVWLEGLTTPA